MWLNALSIEAPSEDSNPNRLSEYVKESLNIPLDFYPLCKFCPGGLEIDVSCFLAVLMDKGIIVGAEHEAAARMNLPFVMFRQSTSVRLFGGTPFTHTERIPVPPFLASHPFTLSRSRSHRGGRHLRFPLQGTNLLCSRARNPSTHHCGGRGRFGKYPSKPRKWGSPHRGRIS